MVISRQQTSKIYNDFTFREFITQFSRKARRAEHEQALAYLRMALDRISEVIGLEDGASSEPAQEQPARRPRHQQQDLDFNPNGELKPITREYVQRLDEQNQANKPASLEELYQPAYDIIKKSFDENRWTADGTLTVLVRDDRYINGIDKYLLKNGLKFSSMQTSRILQGGVMDSASLRQKDSMWALVFQK